MESRRRPSAPHRRAGRGRSGAWPPCGCPSPRRPRPCRGEQALIDQHPVDIRQRKGSPRPGREARRLLDLRPTRDPRLDGVGGQCDLREVGAPVTGHERDHRTAVAEDDDRLDDLVDRTSGGAGSILGGRGALLELLEPRLRSCRTQICGDPFDGLGPALAHGRSVPAAAKPNSARSALSHSTATWGWEAL